MPKVTKAPAKKVAKPKKTVAGDFNHAKKDFFDACGLVKEDLTKKLNALNEEVSKKKLKLSQEVELLEKTLSPRELAIMVKNYQKKTEELLFGGVGAVDATLKQMLESIIPKKK